MFDPTTTHFARPASASWDAVQLHIGDSVAVALRDLAEGHEATIRCEDKLRKLVLPAAIPMGHKLALSHMSAGSMVLKYGEVIGRLTSDVGTGEHVHVHNLVSCRARVTVSPAEPPLTQGQDRHE